MKPTIEIDPSELTPLVELVDMIKELSLYPPPGEERDGFIATLERAKMALCFVGVRFPENEAEVEAFEEGSEGFEYELDEKRIDPEEILEWTKYKEFVAYSSTYGFADMDSIEGAKQWAGEEGPGAIYKLHSVVTLSPRHLTDKPSQ